MGCQKWNEGMDVRGEREKEAEEEKANEKYPLDLCSLLKIAVAGAGNNQFGVENDTIWWCT